MAETKAHAAARRARRRARRTEDAVEDDVDSAMDDHGYEPVGFSRIAQALGDCGSELAAGSVRIAGGLITDMIATFLSPVDRAFDGRRRYRYRDDDYDRTSDRDDERDYDASLSRSVGRAADDAADVVGRAHQQFRETMSGRAYRDTAHDRAAPEDEVPTSKST